MKITTKTLLIPLLLGVLFIASCSGGAIPFMNNQPDGRNTDFYSGSQGVVMRFSDPTSPPARMYFYEDEQNIRYDTDNTFDIMVDVHNVGASWARGGLYVSGYDPNMVIIDEIDIPRLDNWAGCGLRVGSNNNVHDPNASIWEQLGFVANCQGIGGVYRYDENRWGANLQNLGNAFSAISGEDYTNEWWSDVSVAYDNQNPMAGGQSTGMFHFDLGFNNYDYLNHGRGLLVMFSGLSFVRYNGQEYILAPDNYDYPGGERTVIPFTGHIVNWPRGLDKIERGMPFLVTNCYLYTTYAAPQVCIDPNPYGQGQKVCRPDRITYNGGNGAPVAVNYIEQENTRTRVYFDINIKNIGAGKIFDMMKMEFCSPYYPASLRPSDFNMVYLVDARIGEQHLYCTPDRAQGIRLNERGEGSVRCTYMMEYDATRSAYETPLVIELAYGYTETMQRRSMIKRVI